jgi:TolC family type I secretion outer membrane protein
MRRIVTFKAVLLAGTALALGIVGEAPAQTIDDALATAYRTNPSLAAERARLRALDEGVPRALSGWRPTVTLTGSTGKARDTNRQDDTMPPHRTTTVDRLRSPDNATLTLTQPLYRGGRTLADTSRAEHLVQRGRAVLQGAEQTVLLDAATAYANLLRDQATLDLNINNEQVLTRQLQAARDRFQVGEITRTDVSQAEARLERARADRIQAEGNLTSSRSTYERVIGEVPPPRLASARLPPNLPRSENEAREATANHPDVVASSFQERAAKDDVDLVTGEKLPTVNLNGNLIRDTEASTRGFQRDTASVTVSVSVPLYQAGQTDARVREAKQVAGQRRLELDDQKRRTQESARRNWEALNTARARIQAFAAQIRAAEIALDGVEQEARVGLRTVLDVLDAEQELFNAKVNLVGAQRDEIVGSYQLSSSVGRLSAAELGLPVEVYDPTRYYNETRERWTGTDPVDSDRPAAGR